MLKFAAALLLAAVIPASAAEPDGLVLPPGFHASVVAEGVGRGARHLAIRANGDIYVSTQAERDGSSNGIIALHLDRDHKVVETEHFGTIAGGTGIRLYKDALYAATPTAVSRFDFKGNALVPDAPAKIVVDGLPTKGFPSRGIVFDGKGGMYVTVGADSNICLDPATDKSAPPQGLKPCPSLNGRSGVWRFDAAKLDQKFPADGDQIVTGLRDMQAVDWSKRFGGLYGIMQGRNDRIDTVSEEMHRMDKGANLGWPYSYYDNALNARVLAGEYGGDGKKPAEGEFTTPILALPAHESPLDLTFYDGRQFPAHYRDGAFVAFQGGSGAQTPEGHHGYNVTFVPFDKAGKPGTPEVFVNNFAGPDPADRNPGKAAYRPSGLATGPDGSLYVVDTLKGRLWRISYTGQK